MNDDQKKLKESLAAELAKQHADKGTGNYACEYTRKQGTILIDSIKLIERKRVD